VRSYPLDAGALTRSFYDDFRFNGRNVYFTDIGHGAIVVLNLDTGALRRTLDGAPSTKGTRPMIVEGKELPPVFGLGRIIDVDMLEVSASGRWLYYQPAAGPMSRIETRWSAAHKPQRSTWVPSRGPSRVVHSARPVPEWPVSGPPAAGWPPRRQPDTNLRLRSPPEGRGSPSAR
jgi:hypothetical protein